MSFQDAASSVAKLVSSFTGKTSWLVALHLLLGSFGIVYAITAVVSWYRLRKFPAAHWSAHFSYLWLASTTYSGKQYWVHRELHKKHGPVVRIGPNEIITDDTEILKTISSARSKYVRGTWYLTGRFNPYHDSMFSLLDPKIHAKAKARTVSAYSGRETPDLEQGVNGQIKSLVEIIRQRYATAAPNSPTARHLDLGKTSCYFTMDVITRLAFGKEWGYIKDETDHYSFLGGVKDLWPQMSTCADIPWISGVLFSPLFLKFLGPKNTDKSGFGALMRVAEEHVGKRFEAGAKQRQDMLGTMINHGLTKTECEVEGLFMIVAGTESTASAIRSALVHTMTCPHVYQTLKAEIQLAVKEGRVSKPISIQEAKLLPYLQAVIYEALRMRPPLLGLMPKRVPAGGDEFYGMHFPAGADICVNMSSLLRSQALFGPDADVFRPERFLELDEDKRREMERNVEWVFGHGTNQWGCVGKNVAKMVLNKAVFELFREFDLQLLNPMKSTDVLSYGVFLEENMLLKVTDSSTATEVQEQHLSHFWG